VDIAGDDDTGAGGGGGDGTRQQQALCLTPIARKCCEKKDWARYVDHSSESGSCYYTHSSYMSCQLIGVRVGGMPFHFTASI
jgi:hypothetical protein